MVKCGTFYVKTVKISYNLYWRGLNKIDELSGILIERNSSDRTIEKKKHKINLDCT